MEDTTIFDQLKEEHAEVKELLRKAEVCDVSERSDMLEEIEKHLVPHSRAEEKTLYAMTRKYANKKDDSEAQAMVENAYDDQDSADEMLSELKKCDVEDDQWSQLMEEMKDSIHQHIKIEELQFFAKSEELIPQDVQDELLEAYLDAKSSFEVSLPAQTEISERTIDENLRKIS